MRKVIFRFLLAAYSAAGISFAASLLRDYAVINFSHQDKDFFQSLYVVSMAAGFGVNAIALGGRALERVALGIIVVFGVITILVISPPAGDATYKEVMLVFILLMWLAGAQWSRLLMESGWVFIARIREAISSVLMAGFVIFLGIGVDTSFIAAVAIGTLFCFGVLLAISSKIIHPTNSGDHIFGLRKLLMSIFLTNAATFSINYWAFIQTGKIAQIFGFDVSTAIRFSMYFYQILTIGSVILVTSGFHRLLVKWRVNYLMVLSITLFLTSLFAPLKISIFLVPIFAALAHYGMVIFLQKTFKK